MIRGKAAGFIHHPREIRLHVLCGHRDVFALARGVATEEQARELDRVYRREDQCLLCRHGFAGEDRHWYEEKVT